MLPLGLTKKKRQSKNPICAFIKRDFRAVFFSLGEKRLLIPIIPKKKFGRRRSRIAAGLPSQLILFTPKYYLIL